MSTYEISVYVSRELYDYGDQNYNDGYQAQKRAATFIDGAFNLTSHSVDLVTPNDKIPAPVESSHTQFDATCPCGSGSTTCTYDQLVFWWKRYNDCSSTYTADDCNLLLTSTSATDGGYANDQPGQWGHAQTGRHICDLSSSYEWAGKKSEHDAMHTALEEIGHNLLKSPSTVDGDNDGDGSHDCGQPYNYNSNFYAISPMGVNDKELDYDGGTNDCNESWNYDPTGWALRWSYCCYNQWKST